MKMIIDGSGVINPKITNIDLTSLTTLTDASENLIEDASENILDASENIVIATDIVFDIYLSSHERKKKQSSRSNDCSIQ